MGNSRATSLFLLAALNIALAASNESQTGKLCTELSSRRERLSSLHEERIVRQIITAEGHSKSASWQEIVDFGAGKWRQTKRSGAGYDIRLFDGKNLFSWEEGEKEYVLLPREQEKQNPAPNAYDFQHFYWSQANERQRVPCSLPNLEHECVVVDVPIQPWTRYDSVGQFKIKGGTAALVLDTETGILLSSRLIEIRESRDGVTYQSDIQYQLKSMRYGGPLQQRLFDLPSPDMKQVKKLTPWNAERMKKQLAGRPAPELRLNDVDGREFDLSALKGRTVLLDFWTSWCPPCRADAPALEKLNRTYSGKDLAIIGISVDEDRSTIEKFLHGHPHSYPIALTTENEMPRPYQVELFPTYIVIDRNGNVSSAMEGDKGFTELRRVLKKAGLTTD